MGRAVGIEVLGGSRRHRFRASREVLLSAGTCGSAQLLLRSGASVRPRSCVNTGSMSPRRRAPW
ncbi:GMC family oxidoreductase N-terminal domain-containing protein [Streptomyces sp. NPDC086519]|uniref:GMC family oxidoreductase N-terminal domain-containing protein n=1 Tax=unclassified Streptomyces TaxID=2593676 RepID=UPI0034285179